MKKYTDYKPSREEYLKAIYVERITLESVLMVLGYLRNNEELLHYMKTQGCKSKFGKPLLNCSWLSELDEANNERAAAMRESLGNITELIVVLEALRHDLTDHENYPIMAELDEYANVQLNIYTHHVSSFYVPVEEDEEKECVTYIYFDLDTIILEV
jgi:hypothetical protein